MNQIQRIDQNGITRKYEKDILTRHIRGELEYLTFPLLDECDCVKHLFSTRLGGVSQGCYGTMNLSTNGEEDRAVILENYRRIAAVLDEPLDRFVKSKQTHTTNVLQVTGEDAGKGIVRELTYTDVDGLITNEPGLVLTTTYADCVPLYFVDPVHKAIGLSHSGWRGTVGKMGQATLEAMRNAFDTDPKDVLCCIGPSICKDCYEVSEDVKEAFEEAFASCKHLLREGETLYTENGNGKYQLDLWTANKLVLLAAGVTPEHIQITDICTCCNPEYLHSHRASHGKRGLLGAFLVLTQ